MKRLPYLSNDRLGSQQASRSLSLFPISDLVHVLPPSKVTPANIPAAGNSTLVTITMFFGLVGVTAMASSDSLPGRWLTSMFVGVALPDGAAAATPVELVIAKATREPK